MVTYANLTHRATILGSMFSGAEIWTTNLFIGNTGGGDQGTPPTDAEALAIFNAFKTFWQTSSAGFHGSYALDGVKVSYVNTEGQTDPAFTKFYTAPTPVGGQMTGAAPFPQLALAMTLGTAKARGKGSKGRMYLPGVAFGTDSSGRLAIANAQAIANAGKAFIDAVNASADVPGEVVLNSAGGIGVPSTGPQMNKVTTVKVGTVMDTQRRRRNQLVEQYATATLA